MNESKQHLPGMPLTRRQLIKRALAASSAFAVPNIIPASALGRGGAVAPSERIVMGGIGLGGRGSSDLRWMLAERDVQWVAVCDVMKSRRDAAKNMVDKKTLIKTVPCMAICASCWPSVPMWMPC
ncbi:MAG: hypothetical protein NTV46_17900 [Verrucomicrobia bacterium]|nr:hypothetical protein [Verrucomicrobiota bacterium]